MGKHFDWSHLNILVYDISCKISIIVKPLRIGYDEIDGFIKIYNRIRHLVLFDCGGFDKICDRIRYLISKKSSVKHSFNHNFARIRIDSYNSLPKYSFKF